MFIYEKRTSIRYFENFKKAQPHLDTLLSVLGDFKVTVDYTRDLPICVESEFFYPVREEA